MQNEIVDIELESSSTNEISIKAIYSDLFSEIDSSFESYLKKMNIIISLTNESNAIIKDLSSKDIYEILMKIEDGVNKKGKCICLKKEQGQILLDTFNLLLKNYLNKEFVDTRLNDLTINLSNLEIESSQLSNLIEEISSLKKSVQELIFNNPNYKEIHKVSENYYFNTSSSFLTLDLGVPKAMSKDFVFEYLKFALNRHLGYEATGNHTIIDKEHNVYEYSRLYTTIFYDNWLLDLKKI